MGLRDKLRRVKDSLRREPNNNKPLQTPGVVKQLVGSTITSAYTSTSALTSAPEPLRNAANITAGGKLPINPVPIVQNKSLGAIQSNELNDLWLQAVDTLKSQEPDLMEDYSRILLDEANINPVGGITQNAPISNDALVQLTKAKLDNFTTTYSRSGNMIEKVVKVVMAANNFIGSTLQSEPHAAIAWAGVSMFLPLLINPITEKAGRREGLDKIPPLIDRYALLESSLWNSTSSEEQRSSTVKLRLRSTMAKLYASILLYEARVIVQLRGKPVTRYIRDALKLNDWASMFKEITELDQQCGDMIDAIDRDLNRKVTQEQQTLLTNASNKFNEAQALQRAKDHQDCLQSFRTGNLYELQKSRNPNRIPGTCKWVLEHSTFIDWKQGNGPGILWISADPGYGKTVLSKALVDECLVATDQNTTICYFFFKDISKEQRSLTKALAALLHQIFSSQNHLLAYTESSWAKNNAEIANLADEMWDIITKISMDPKSGNIICILDALDECEAAGRTYFLKQLQTLYKTTASSKSKVKFLITSRPYYEIEEDFKSLTDTFPGIRLAGEDTTAIIKQEINLVIDAEVNKLKLPSKADTRLRTRLKDIEHRTYLWLYLILDTIRFRAQASKRSKTFEKILDEPLPATIDEAKKPSSYSISWLGQRDL
ncbi:hypothetical protein OCU04_008550 [Sclerotinia nivalis]|uniref:NWD NACHT-NTPase N-terminal domain-containing protein n=1 Tax=Sclerotinia nivalis TaxID=352851 RepID=A0A9X0AIA6_9HELO|nr:hypothetical protein OCU04_008550 [Sclerotinia nivalis]